MKASKQQVPAFYLFLDSWCISSAITIWTFSSGSLPLPADLPQVPQCHLQIHSGHYSYSRNFLFSIPCWFSWHLPTQSVPPSRGFCPSHQLFPEISLHWACLESHSALWGGERGCFYPREMLLRESTSHLRNTITSSSSGKPSWINFTSQWTCLWIHRICFLASTFCNSSHAALRHFSYYHHASLLMFHILRLSSHQLNFKFLEESFTSRYSSYCLDFNKFAVWPKLWLDSKIHFAECPKQED